MQHITRELTHVWRVFGVALALALIGTSIRPGFAQETGQEDKRTGFLVVAADRGFIGNEEIIDEFQAFAKSRNVALTFVTDERTEKYLKKNLDALLQGGAERIVVAPLFLSAAEPRFVLARALLERNKPGVPLVYARPYGESYFAVEDLADRFRGIQAPKEARVVVIGYGATGDENERKIKADLARIADKAAAGFGFASTRVLVGHDKTEEDDIEVRASRLQKELTAAAEEGGAAGKSIVVPFHLGPKLDSMMSFDSKLKWLLPAGADILAEGDRSSPASGLSVWLQREAHRSRPYAAEDVGVVLLAHGSDFNWNETMREAVEPLAQRYKIEFAFSMADPVTVERALRRLEQRGAKAAVIVRVYGMESSFRKDIERMVGLDIEEGDASGGSGYGGFMHGHGGGAPTHPAPRIRTALPVQTVGGVGASPLFAAALLDRAQALSRNPARDTVILVAHGSGSDHVNEMWNRLLEEIAGHMRKAGGDKFHAIRVATWREDWPDKRASWIEKIRGMVTEAGSRGGRAIVIPARTTGEGPEKQFLSGLEYDLGSGFAPHPLFVRWVDENIQAGLARLDSARQAGVAQSEKERASYLEGWLR
ncbi:CbiX protein [Nitrosovibrio sp. Nv17]|nr:CbiX protein [Nitrosovibrio sp. Nv17]